MPKSKEFVSSSDSDSDGEPRTKKKKAEKKPEKKSPEKKPKAKSSGADDEHQFELSKMRFVTVCQFKGRTMVNIREFYEKDGEMRPGKKGIALNLEQWKRFKAQFDEIDEAVKSFE